MRAMIKFHDLPQLFPDGDRYHKETSPMICSEINGLVSI